jgi:hypothetical protein
MRQVNQWLKHLKIAIIGLGIASAAANDRRYITGAKLFLAASMLRVRSARCST